MAPLRRGDLINVIKASQGTGLYYLEDRTACNSSGVVPWPIVWLLGDQSEKFRHATTSRGETHQLYKAITTWANKVRCRDHFDRARQHDMMYGNIGVHMHGDQDCSEGSYWSFLRSKHNRSPGDPGDASDTLEGLISTTTTRTV